MYFISGNKPTDSFYCAIPKCMSDKLHVYVCQCTYVNAVFRFIISVLRVLKFLAWGYNVRHIKNLAVKMLN